MSERLFEGNFTKGKGFESNILAATDKLVVVQSLASHRGDIKPTFLKQKSISLELVPHNTQPVFDQTLKSFDVDSEEEEEEETPLGKGKMVEPHTKGGGKRRYVTRGETQKLMGDALVENEVQTERNRRERWDGLVPAEKPIEINFDDIVRVVAKRKNEEEDEWVKAKRSLKSVKKSPMKRNKVVKKVPTKPIFYKGPGTTVQKQVEGRELTREKRVAELEKQKVLNGWEHLFKSRAPYMHKPEVREFREFYYKIDLLDDGGIQTTVKEVKIYLNEESLGFILGVPSEGIRSIEGCKPSSEFAQWATKCGDIKRVGLPKKFLKEEYQLMFEFINKVLVPRSKKRIVASAADLFLMKHVKVEQNDGGNIDKGN
ncbi:hypothetical protein H5410_015832 [Solanum commersonii]|uniref:Uncharacterized protein n=1 Tax=Solanum commersonii TaxID=4109 RepID=A0A9J5ZUX6_SOLCO|nr:hypothetical protein H5410_015832 [Solanum commersonii]